MSSAAIYARVSSARQKEQQTIGSQTAALRTHAEQLGLEVPEQWVFCDDGHSGATLVRPALEKLRDLVAQVPVDVVLVYAPDRLARKYAYQALLIEELAKAGTSVMFVKGPSSDSPQDALPLSRLVAAPARGWRSRAAPTGTSSTIRTRSLARGQEAERRALTGAGRWIPPRPVR